MEIVPKVIAKGLPIRFSYLPNTRLPAIAPSAAIAPRKPNSLSAKSLRDC